MKKPVISTWRSEEAKQRFRETEYALWLERWAELPAAVDVPTFAGTTRLYRWPGGGEPIVFLHGMGGTGLMWSPYVEQLAGRELWAIDTIGDVGRSEQDVALVTRDDLARWLDESLVGAGIERAHLAGTSYGAFLALNLAHRRPERVASLALIDAGGLAPFRLARFMLWGLPMLLGSKAPDRVRVRLARKRPLLEDPRIMQLALLGQVNHPFGLPQPEVLTDDELRSIPSRAVAIIAGRSAPFPPKIAARRAALMPGAEVVVIDRARHDVSISHVDACVSHIRRVSGQTP